MKHAGILESTIDARELKSMRNRNVEHPLEIEFDYASLLAIF